MNGEFFIEGKKYISASRAAKLTGYAMDYIGQLARGGKIESKMIGRGWFVNEESLLGYKRDVLDLLYAAKKARKAKVKKARSRKLSKLSKTAPIVFETTTPVVVEKLLPVTAELSIDEQSAMPAVTEPVQAEATDPILPAGTPAEDIGTGPVPISSSIRFVTLGELAAIRSGKVSSAMLRARHARKAEAATVQLPAAVEVEAIAPAPASQTFSLPVVHADLPEIAFASIQSDPEISPAPAAFSAPAIEHPAPAVSPYYEFNFLKGLGNLFLGAAAAAAIVVIAMSAGAAYKGAEAGTLALGNRARGTGEVATRILARTPLYLHAGVAAVGRSLALGTDTPEIAGTSPDNTTEKTFLAHVASLGSRISDLLDSTLAAISNGTVNVFGKLFVHVNVRTTKLATDASENKIPAPRPDDAASSLSPENNSAEQGSPARSATAQQGMAIVPSTGNAAEDKKITSYIKESFSDEVKVVSKNDDGTGVIQPVFKSGKEDKYLYVLVPVQTGS